MAKSGDSRPLGAHWGRIDEDGRLHVSTELFSGLAWYVPNEAGEVLIEIREKGSIILHSGKRQAQIEEQREILLEELGDNVEALRKIALSHAVFLPATIGKKNRRLSFSAAVLAHLESKKGARVLCLVYADYLEVLSEARAAELIDIMRNDIHLKPQSGQS